MIKRHLILIVAIAVMLAMGQVAEGIDSYDLCNEEDTTTAGVSNVSWHAMTFTVEKAFTISGVKLRVYTSEGVEPDFVVASIRATNGTIPTGTDLWSNLNSDKISFQRILTLSKCLFF